MANIGVWAGLARRSAGKLRGSGLDVDAGWPRDTKAVVSSYLNTVPTQFGVRTQFCDECGSMMLIEDAVWRCQSCESERPRDPEVDPKMTLRDRQQGDDPTPVVEGDDGSGGTVEEDCPAAGCDSERARYEMMPKPGGSYEVRLFTCVECGRKWRG